MRSCLMNRRPRLSLYVLCSFGETQLCAKTGECKAGKCAGFTAEVSIPTRYALGACLP